MYPQVDRAPGVGGDTAGSSGETMDSPQDSGMESDDSDDDMDMDMDACIESDEDFFSSKSESKSEEEEKEELVVNEEPPIIPIEMAPKFQMSLRQRRMSKSETLPLLNIQRAMQGRAGFHLPASLPETRPRYSGKQNWKRAFAKLKMLGDPWKDFHLDELEPESATRHRYNALKKQWVTDEVVVKMQKKVTSVYFFFFCIRS
jgi:elongation factor 2 kinase